MILKGLALPGRYVMGTGMQPHQSSGGLADSHPGPSLTLTQVIPTSCSPPNLSRPRSSPTKFPSTAYQPPSLLTSLFPSELPPA